MMDENTQIDGAIQCASQELTATGHRLAELGELEEPGEPQQHQQQNHHDAPVQRQKALTELGQKGDVVIQETSLDKAHLAHVQNDDEAKVISWHILGDMDCVVTETTAAAKRIYDDTHGRQQVIPLETVFWRPNTRPLPHIRNGSPLFRPLGNPVFVKDLLIFPEHVDSCNKVFNSLLGDTILVDDLDSANHYRRGVVQNKMQCPTILTRQGERIRSNGKFGGLQNKAPSIEKLRGQVFGAPLPREYNSTRVQIELLQQFSSAMQKASKVQSEYNSHIQYLQSPEMKQKKQELRLQEKELRDVEKTLASAPERLSRGATVKRNLEPEMPEPSVPSKRSRRQTRKPDK